jgi:hypothetical protein
VTNDSTSLRVLATTLRKKFQGHSETTRRIVSEMSDAELCAEYKHFTAETLTAQRIAKDKRALTAPLAGIYQRALRASKFATA